MASRNSSDRTHNSLLDLLPDDVNGKGARAWATSLGRKSVRQARLGFPARSEPARGPVDVVDLFCGCGGLSFGFELVGRLAPSYRLSAAVDIDRHSARTYESNLSLKPLLRDLSQVASSPARIKRLRADLGLRPGAPLVVVGGPPCQGFSAHRKKDGRFRDARDSLVASFAKIALSLDPDVVVLENVPELLAKKSWHLFNEYRDAFSRAGYAVTAEVHNLAGFGVPQERFRALVVASKFGFPSPKPIRSPGRYRTVRDTIGGLDPVVPGQDNTKDLMHVCTNHRKSTVDVIRRVPLDGGKRPRGVGPSCLDRVDGFRDVYCRMYWDRPANTITGYARNPASGRYIHPEQDRGLTIREAALLQGFPKSYIFEGPFDDKFSQIGNAVPPIFSSYLAAYVLGAIMGGESAGNMVQGVTSHLSNSFSSGIAGRKRTRAR